MREFERINLKNFKPESRKRLVLAKKAVPYIVPFYTGRLMALVSYGSAAENIATKNSDADVAIIVTELKDDLLEENILDKFRQILIKLDLKTVHALAYSLDEIWHDEDFERDIREYGIILWKSRRFGIFLPE